MKFSTAAIATAAIAGVSAQGYNTTVVVTATSEALVQSTDVVTITSCTGSNVVSCHYVTSTPVPANATTPAVVAPESSAAVAPVPAPASNLTSSNVSAPAVTTVAEATGAATIISGSVFGAIAVAGVALLL